MRPVCDRPIPEGNVVQPWLQDDPQRAHVPYAGWTVGDSGRGLVCAAMAPEHMALQRVTPLRLAGRVGDSRPTGGVDDTGESCRYIGETCDAPDGERRAVPDTRPRQWGQLAARAD